MSGRARREQLVQVSKALFAEKGFEAASIEEVAHRANVSKPVVYEHFGGKEGLYAVVVDREMHALLNRVTEALVATHPRRRLEQAAVALLTYIEDEQDGFRILLRDSPVASTSGNFASLVGDMASQVEHILAEEFRKLGYDPTMAPLYSHALVGMVALVGQWWVDAEKPSRDEVAAHLVNLAWNGLSHLDPNPKLGRG
ncbi:MAG: TetR/AcrR family transcriptional regulator [Actinomycetota bacterium]|nr:TetR/AcrR family transcriptional regulator [Actinomycetota bacterium]